MDLFVPYEDKDSVKYYKLLKNNWQDSIIKGVSNWAIDVRPTITKTESFESNCLYGTDIFFYSEVGDVYVLTSHGKDFVGKSLASNVGVASNGCDHFYDDVYKYYYSKNYLVRELSSAIRCYYDTLDCDIDSARINLNRIKDFSECTRSDIYYMFSVLESLDFHEEREFTNLDDLAKFILSSNSNDAIYVLPTYKEEIQGLSIGDIFSKKDSRDSYVISTIKNKLCDIEKFKEVMAFTPEVKAKQKELERILWRKT